MIRSYVESFVSSFPLICLVSWFAGWQLNILHQLTLTALYVSSSMCIHRSAWRIIGLAIREREERKQDDH